MSNISRRNITPIRETNTHMDKKVNLIGIVLEFSFPRKSKGTDYVSILKVVDDSQRNPELSVSIFTEKHDQLPHLKSFGDLIVLHDVLIEQFENEVVARFNKKFSSFALFNGKVIDDFHCYQSLGNFSLTWSEKDILNSLRRWCSASQLDSGRSDYLVTMNNISKGAYFDLVCQVVHVSFEVSKGLWMLFLWDGTDVPPLSLRGRVNDEEQNPLPLQIESSPLDRSIGKWVRIRHMTCQSLAGMWYGSLTSASRLRFLDNDDSVVVDYNRKRKRGDIRLPLWRNPISITEIGLETSVQFVTLMDIITFEEDAVFGSIVRVVAIHPSQVDDLFSSNETNDHKMRFTIEDPTARIHAFLSGEDWVEFFEEVTSPQLINAKLKKLTGVPEHQNLEDDCERSPPWIRCCIDATKFDVSGNKLYSICFTKLVNE